MISCHDHDYIEIACLYHFSVTLRLDDGKVVAGVAMDTVYDNNKKECIELEVNGARVLFDLAQLVSIKANNKNPHFECIEFK